MTVKRKKAKGTKKCVIKRRLMFENYKDCLFNDKNILKPQQRFKSDYNKVCTEEVNKTALSSNDDKRLQTFDNATTYPHGTNAFKVCESGMFMVIIYNDLALNYKNHNEETNKSFKMCVAKCILNKSIRFLKGEMRMVMNAKIFCLIIQIISKKQSVFLR